MAKKVIVRLELTKDAKNRLVELSKRTGMTQSSACSRLYEWFAKQPELLQAAVLGQYPKKIEGEIAEMILNRLFGDKKDT